MTAYFERDGIVLYHGDCREMLPMLARESVDLLVTDPPYGANWSGTTRLATSRLGLIVGDDGSLDVPAIIGGALRVLRNHRHLYVFEGDSWAIGPCALAVPTRVHLLRGQVADTGRARHG